LAVVSQGASGVPWANASESGRVSSVSRARSGRSGCSSSSRWSCGSVTWRSRRATASLTTRAAYDIHARSIDASQGFAHIGPGPAGRTAFRPPGYPYLLAGAYALSGVERAQTSTRVVVGRVANALVGTVIVALTAPGSRAASARTVTARPPCDLEGPCRSLTGMDYRSVRIEMAQRRIRYNRG
jgi:hypothetical protein